MAREGAVLRAEVLALLERRPSLLAAEERRRKLRQLQRRGMGLTLKFSLLVSALVVLVVAGVAGVLVWQIGSIERIILAKGLEGRATLLIDSAAARAAAAMQGGSSGYAALSGIPDSVSAMGEEALYLTITGPADAKRPGALTTEAAVDRDYLWATSDKLLVERSFEPGWEKPDDEDLPYEEVDRMASKLNAVASQQLNSILAEELRLDTEVKERAKSLGADPSPDELKAYTAMLLELAKVQEDGRKALLALVKEPGRDWSGSPARVRYRQTGGRIPFLPPHLSRLTGT